MKFQFRRICQSSFRSCCAKKKRQMRSIKNRCGKTRQHSQSSAFLEFLNALSSFKSIAFKTHTTQTCKTITSRESVVFEISISSLLSIIPLEDISWSRKTNAIHKEPWKNPSPYPQSSVFPEFPNVLSTLWLSKLAQLKLAKPPSGLVLVKKISRCSQGFGGFQYHRVNIASEPVDGVWLSRMLKHDQ